MTLPEVMLWQAVRANRLNGLKFRRQHPAGPYILDFFCAERDLAIEVDGGVHGDPDQIAHDQRRDAWLRERGIVVLRLPASYVVQGLSGVLEMIGQAAEEQRQRKRSYRVRP
ncbi:very-short-patch-repair endonuclease [Caulobacter ginsengisoli]|uniref:Very-short-patch-repair endonuclease n=2 Tax=Caulobacter ginsengisoli TaxID=400775 RepID=A0ABU0IS44_9CAUL|nr:very-short-patch-repair endonuclease [Caulobacter ginsengisoli]